MIEKLSKNILATISYYDGLEYPLTSFEVWKNLITVDYYENSTQPVNVSLGEVIKKLQSPELAAFIEQKNGFYFLKGRGQLISMRILASKTTAGKLKRLRRVIWFLRFVPFVRMVGITGRLAMKNARAKSDWDLLIVTCYGKIWTCRTLVTCLIHGLGKRRHANKIKDRTCLNFFVTEQSLEVITKDLFSASEYMFLYPMFGWQIYQRFQIKNQWIRKMKPSYGLVEIKPLKMLEDSFLSKNIRNFGEKMLAWQWIENFLKKIEKKQIMLNPKTHKEGSLIYANDDALVFLPTPHGPKYFENFKEKINSLNI